MYFPFFVTVCLYTVVFTNINIGKMVAQNPIPFTMEIEVYMTSIKIPLYMKIRQFGLSINFI